MRARSFYQHWSKTGLQVTLEGTCEKQHSFSTTVTSAGLHCIHSHPSLTQSYRSLRHGDGEPTICHSCGFLSRVPKPSMTSALSTFPTPSCLPVLSLTHSRCISEPLVGATPWRQISGTSGPLNITSKKTSHCSCVNRPAAFPSYSLLPSVAHAVICNYLEVHFISFPC